MILCIGTTPAAQRVMVFGALKPGEVNRAHQTLDGPAGKSINVAKVLRTLGANPLALALLGGARGEMIRRDLAAKGITLDAVDVPAETRECITVIDTEAGDQTELVEESLPVPIEAYHVLTGLISERIAACDAIVLSGTLTPQAPTDFYRRCVQLAQNSAVLSVLDARGVPLKRALSAHPGLVKPNRSELAETLGRPLSDEPDLVAAMRELAEQGAERVVVTAGTRPTLAFDGARFWRITPPTVVVKNPIGSGDAFTAALTWRLVCGDDLGEACRWGSAAGAANALTLMPGEIPAEELPKLADLVTVEELTGY